MKKQAFSLIEVLVALGIVGIISVLLVQSVGHVRPDSTKVAYLKAYDGLRDTVARLVNDSSIYSVSYTTTNGENYDVSDFPLFNFNEALGFSGGSKLCNLLKYAFNGTKSTEQVACVESGNSPKYNFTTPQNGIQWRISPPNGGNPLNSANTQVYPNGFSLNHEVTIGIPVKNSDSLQEFTFIVTADGNVFVKPEETTNAKLGWYYIKTRHNLKATTMPEDFENPYTEFPRFDVNDDHKVVVKTDSSLEPKKN